MGRGKYLDVDSSDSEYECSDSVTTDTSCPSSPARTSSTSRQNANTTVGERELAEALALLSFGQDGFRNLGRNYRVGGGSISPSQLPQHSPSKKGNPKSQSARSTSSPRKIAQAPRTPTRQHSKTIVHASSPAQTPNTSRAQRQNSQVISKVTSDSRSQPSTVIETPSSWRTPQSSQQSSQTSIASDIINGAMSASEIIQIMQRHGCTDLTSQLDTDSFKVRAESRGGFGDVFRGKLQSGDPIAVKLPQIFLNDSREEKHLKLTAREMHTWSKCKHTNVVSFLGLAEFRDQIAMISPWAENGDLPQFLKKNPQVDRWKLCKGIAKGLAYLHRLKLASIHGDLKGPNVLISASGSPMLTDFGGSKLMESSIEYSGSHSRPTYTTRWAAPEVLDPDIDIQSINRYAADVYSLGMTILQTLTGKVPYAEITNDVRVIRVVLSKKLPVRPEDAIPSQSDYGDFVWQLLENCWHCNPEERPSAAEVRNSSNNITWKGLKEWD